MAKYIIRFISKKGEPRFDDIRTFGSEDAVSVAKIVWEMANTGKYKDIVIVKDWHRRSDKK